MLLHGDELGRTQNGNNNVYAQDNELAWVDWERAREFGVLTDFVARLTQLRRQHPVFRRRRYFSGRPVRGSDMHDIAWLTPTCELMSDEDWDSGYAKSLMVFFNGDAIHEVDGRGEPVLDDSFLLMFNAHHEPIEFCVPDEEFGERWTVEVDTFAPLLDQAEPRSMKPGDQVEVAARSVLVLRRVF
jgi:glycogen operon protein